MTACFDSVYQKVMNLVSSRQDVNYTRLDSEDNSSSIHNPLELSELSHVNSFKVNWDGLAEKHKPILRSTDQINWAELFSNVDPKWFSELKADEIDWDIVIRNMGSSENKILLETKHIEIKKKKKVSYNYGEDNHKHEYKSHMPIALPGSYLLFRR
jgi:hypothetical protein